MVASPTSTTPRFSSRSVSSSSDSSPSGSAAARLCGSTDHLAGQSGKAVRRPRAAQLEAIAALAPSVLPLSHRRQEARLLGASNQQAQPRQRRLAGLRQRLLVHSLRPQAGWIEQVLDQLQGARPQLLAPGLSQLAL